MGLEVKITTPAGFAVQAAAARRRAVVKGGTVILGIARQAAPRDTGQMVEDSRVELDLADTGEGAAIIFAEDYAVFQDAVFQEKGEHYQHPHGGGPHFLENALIHGHEKALEVIAAEIRRAMGHA